MTMQAPAEDPALALARLRAAHRAGVFVAYAMLASLVVYAGVVELIGRNAPEPMLAYNDAIRWIFYSVAAAIVFATHVVHAVLAHRARNASPMDQAAKMTAANIVTLALAEAPAMLGLVLFFVWRQQTDFYVMCAFSLYLIIRHFPRFGEWERIARTGTH